MKNIFKIFFLIVALVVPSLIYLFLRGFGENQFSIPIFYENGISIAPCNTNNDESHFVLFEDYKLENAQLFYLPKWVNDNNFYSQSNRIKIKHPLVTFTAISDSSFNNSLGSLLLVADEEQLFSIANCALVLGQDSAISKPIYNKLILVDRQKRIRGYYQGNDLEDMDRLDMELDILSKVK